MKFLLLFCNASLLLSLTLLMNKPEKVTSSGVVIGYVTEWTSLPISQIQGNYLTHILYAFLFINQDGSLRILDSSQAHFTQLEEMVKKYPHLKVLPSIGGANNSTDFLILNTDAKRQVFADSCKAFIQKHKFHGIDIDWEYPANADQQASYGKLLEILKKTLGSGYEVMSAVAAGVDYMEYFNIKAMNDYLDYVLVMGYDFAGSWSTTTSHNAPLKGGQYSVEGAVNTWVSKGIIPKKIVVGVPFYGGKFNAQSHTVGSPGQYIQLMTYDEIKSAPMTREWDSNAQTSYGYSGNNWYTFDDAESLQKKVDYACSAYGGAMIWELSQNRDQSLLKAVYDEVKSQCGIDSGNGTTTTQAPGTSTSGSSTTAVPTGSTTSRSTTAVPTAGPTTTSGTGGGGDCPQTPAEICKTGNNLGYASYPPDCNKFVSCVAYVIMDCPEGLVWNPTINACDWSTNYACVPCQIN